METAEMDAKNAADSVSLAEGTPSSDTLPVTEEAAEEAASGKSALPETAPAENDEDATTTKTTSPPARAVAAAPVRQDEENDEAPRLSSWRLGLIQIGAMVAKNLRTKWRTPFSTLLEIMSPVGMMIILAAASSLSDITFREAQTYHTVQVNVNPWVDLVTQVVAQQVTVSPLPETRRRLERWIDLPEEEDPVVPYGRVKGVSALQFPLWSSMTTPWDEPSARGRRQLQLSGGADDDDAQDDEEDEEKDVFDFLNDLRRELGRFLRNPLVVPSFAEYILLSRALSTAINVDDLPRVFADSSFGRQWGNLLTLGTLHLSPASSTVTQAFGNYLNESFPILMDQELVKMQWHETEGAALEYIDETNAAERTWALLDLTDWPTNGDSMDVQYKIRMNYTTLPNTNEIIDFVSVGLNTEYQQYYLSGFLTLQQTLNEFAFSYTRQGDCLASVQTIGNVWSMPMPTAAFSQNVFFLAVGYLLGLAIAMAFLYPTSRLIKSIVEEKETRMRETLYILGVKPWANWWSWLITSVFVFLVIGILVTYTLSTNVLKFSSVMYLFLWIGLFSTASIGFCFTIAAFFSKAKLASIVGPMALFATLLPRFIFFDFNRYEASTARKWVSLLPATAFAFGADIVADYEYAEQGIQSWNAGEGEYSFNTSIQFLFFDTFLYLFLGWYIDQVMPREYGVAQPLWFLVSPTYWCACPSSKGSQLADSDTADTGLGGANASESDGNNETVHDQSLIPRVIVKDLVKKYNKNTDPAVNHLSLTLYESQITTLLGHNGAGKSTMISLLTGLFPPTSGDALIYGKSIVNEPSEARASLGICPQQNILFERLTVLEHIRFFQRIKGLSPDSSKVKHSAEEAGLEEFFHTTAAALSGGNKRKLCVAIALSGNPKTLVLDEPTSGMDPNARRRTWELLRKKRVGRTILLCTHFMDEAELLSDRIAVMRSGQLQCSGSPIYLKNTFGCGYNLTVVMDPSRVRSEEDQAGAATSEGIQSTAEDLLRIIQSNIPEAEISRIGGYEANYSLPSGQEELFSDCFDAIEEARGKLGIGAFGIENASLEEVFIRLAEEEEDNAPSSAPLRNGEVEHSSPQSFHQSQVISSWRQVSVLFWKRISIQQRDLKGTFFAVVLPALVVGLVLLLLTISVPLAGPALELSPDLYRFSNLGGAAVTDIWAGGGIALGDDSSAVDNKFESFRSALTTEYANAEVIRKSSSLSSQNLSESLLETINSRDHNVRYGGIVFDDIITLVVKSNFTDEDVDAITSLDSSLGRPSIELLAFLLSEGADAVGLNISQDEILEGLIASNFDVSDLLQGLPRNARTTTFELTSEASILHNASSPHAVAAFNQVYAEYMFKQCTGNTTARLVSLNHPLPLTTEQTVEIEATLSALAAIFILIPYCYIPGAFIVFLVKERACKAKHLQLVSGVTVVSYWIATYLYDMFLYSILTLLVMLIFLIYGSDSARVFVGDAESFFCTFLLTLGYGFSALPFSYLIARRFDNPSSAQIAVIGLIFISGFVALIAYLVMSSIEKTEDLADILRIDFRAWPAFNVGDGLIQMAGAYWAREVLGEDRNPLDWDVSGKSIALLYGLIVPYFGLLLVLEYAQDGGAGGSFGSCLRSTRDIMEKLIFRLQGLKADGGSLRLDDGLRDDIAPDADVLKEQLFVQENFDTLKATAPVVIYNLWKVYPASIGLVGSAVAALKRAICSCGGRRSAEDGEEDKRAVQPKRAIRGVSYNLQKGETFFLLGNNGAGKSTTMGVITGDVAATQGHVFVSGNDITGREEKNGLAEARRKIGFCPQTDPLLDLATTRETLVMFGRLRGVPFDQLHSVVDRLMDRLTITPHADKTTASLSGGNKRKLSLGIAMIGNPALLLIDESSSGLDPLAKRKLWNLISDISKDKTVMSTTHNMEEAEALGTRVGIMANGRLLCLGSVQHLKSTYLDGYTLDVFCQAETTEDQIDAVVKQMLEKVLPGASLLERHGRFLRFDVPSLSTAGLGATFRRIQTLKSSLEYKVENYSIQQCTLEQVFVKLVNEATAKVAKGGTEGSPVAAPREEGEV